MFVKIDKDQEETAQKKKINVRDIRKMQCPS